MKIFLLVICSIFFLSSCEKKDLYSPSHPTDDEIDPSFTFEMKKSVSLTIKAIDRTGQAAEKIPFEVYIENPYTEAGDKIKYITPIYAGYTPSNGILQTTLQTLPTYVTTLYVKTTRPGFGGMQQVDVQDHISLTFGHRPDVAATAALQTKGATETPVIHRKTAALVSSLFKMYVLYDPSEVNKDGIPVNGDLYVEKESFSADFLNLVDEWYPERRNVTDEALLTQSTDLLVSDKDGAEVWATFIGDGGFHINNQGYGNLLAYYQYKDGETPSFEDVLTLRMTIAFPNCRDDADGIGTKVRLMYWDEENQEYTNIFPQGTRIGFVLGRTAYRPESTSPINDNKKYAFSIHGMDNTDSGTGEGHYNFRFSTPALNVDGYSLGIMRWNDTYQCNLLGMEARLHTDKNINNDGDYNDILVKLTASPVVKPDIVVPPPPGTDGISQYSYGTLAFEDNWPRKGDYDFNDVVVDYGYGLTKTTEGKISAITLSLDVKAMGAQYANGFGIELPVSPHTIAQTQLTLPAGVELEEGHEKATFVIRDLRSAFFNGQRGYINTSYTMGVVSGSTGIKQIHIPLTGTLTENEVPLTGFNPFIFVNGDRGREIHLSGRTPTSKSNPSYFGTGDDASVAENPVTYYRMGNKFPWALDFPRSQASSATWPYPLEEKEITQAYPRYEQWTQDHLTNWYDWSVPGNVNRENIYTIYIK